MAEHAPTGLERSDEPLPEGARAERLEHPEGFGLHLLELRAEGEEVVLILPGFYRRAESDTHLMLGRALAKRRAVYLMDFRGHGRSGGCCSFGRHEETDVEVALAALRARGHGRLHLVGLSMGGYAAVKALGARPGEWPEVRSLAVISSPSRWSGVWPRPDPRLPFQARVPRADLLRPPRVDLRELFGRRPEAAERVGRLPCPLQVHHHRGDWLIRFSLGQELFDRAPEPKELHVYGGDGRVDHADHLVRRHFDAVVAHLERWFEAASPRGGHSPEEPAA